MSKDKKVKENYEDRLPTLDIRGKNMVQFRDLQIDDEVKIEVTAKLIRREEGSYESFGCGDPDCEICDGDENKKKMSATFKVTKLVNKGTTKAKYNQKEAGIASKYNELIKQGVNPSTAMARAMKG